MSIKCKWWRRRIVLIKNNILLFGKLCLRATRFEIGKVEILKTVSKNALNVELVRNHKTYWYVDINIDMNVEPGEESFHKTHCHALTIQRSGKWKSDAEDHPSLASPPPPLPNLQRWWRELWKGEHLHPVLEMFSVSFELKLLIYNVWQNQVKAFWLSSKCASSLSYMRMHSYIYAYICSWIPGHPSRLGNLNYEVVHLVWWDPGVYLLFRFYENQPILPIYL